MAQPTPPVSLDDHVAHWNPSPIDTADELSPRRAAELAATLNVSEAPVAGDALPLLWHWVHFVDWPHTDDLGSDGHPSNGHFLPPIPNRRRMFAGGRITVSEPLKIGEPTRRHSHVTNAGIKHGRSGEMLFVTVRHEYRQSDRLMLVEEQDLVYRSGDGASTPLDHTEEPAASSSAPWQHTPVTGTALLFRFSALTGNAHRIHYDQAYTTGIEGFPGLVVHGPLLALYMAELVRTNTDRPIAQFAFRLQRPVFVGDAVRVEGWPARNAAELAVLSGASTVRASSTATFA
jgi:3-methylfumaryl-CoA hydratase